MATRHLILLLVSAQNLGALASTIPEAELSLPVREGEPDIVYQPSTTDDDEETLIMDTTFKIVGGIPAGTKEFPWIANLRYLDYSYSFCGGTLIDKRHIITAAHCITGKTPEEITVYIGDYHRKENDEQEVKRYVHSIFAHSEYNKYTIVNDIAILKLTEEVYTIQPIGLYPSEENNPELTGKVTVAGWGSTTEGGQTSDTLLKVEVDLVSKSSCEQSYRREKPKMFCAAAKGKDSCQGDSGGPAVMFDGFDWKLIGLVSHGIGCAQEGYPGVYTDCRYFEKWINKVLSI